VNQGVILLLVNKPKKVCNPNNNNSFQTKTLGNFNLKNKELQSFSHQHKRLVGILNLNLKKSQDLNFNKQLPSIF
jgi:hypothetical protein